MAINHITRITCDVPDCTNSVEVNAWARGYPDDSAEIEHDSPKDWTTYESCRCPSCNERWQNTRFEPGDRVKVVYDGRVVEGTIVDRFCDVTRTPNLYRLRPMSGGLLIVSDWLMVKVQS